MLDQNGNRPLIAYRKKTVVMNIEAHLEQARHDQQTYAEPRCRFHPLLDGGNQIQLIQRIQSPRGGQDQDRARDQTPDQSNRGQEVYPER